MTKDIGIEDAVPPLSAEWFDPLEAGVRDRIRSFIEGMLEEELDAAFGRARYDRRQARAVIVIVAAHRTTHHSRPAQ